MSKGALAFIAGLGTGYLNQKNREDEKARQDKFDQIALDRAADEKADRERKKKTVSEVGEASQEARAVEVQDHSVSSPASNARTDDVAALPIAAQGIISSQSEQPPTSTSPIASQGIQKSTWQVGKQSFSDSDSANKAAQEYNKPETRNARIAQVYRSNGDHETALRIEEQTKQAEFADFKMKVARHEWGRKLVDEGIVDVAKAANIGDAAGMLKAMNATGDHKAQNLTLTPVDTKLADGTPRRTYIANYELIKPDGSVQKMQSTSTDLMKLSLSANDALSFNMQEEAKAFMRKHQDDTFAEQKRSNRAQEGISAGHFKLSQAREQREADSFRRQSPEGQIDFIEKAIGVLFSKDDRRKYLLKAAGLGEKTEDHQKFAQDIVMEQVKAGTLTAAQAPDAVGAVVQGFAIAKQKQINESTIKSELSKLVGKPEYVDAYKEALATGATPEYLKTLGFDNPVNQIEKKNKNIAGSGVLKPTPIKASEYQGESDGARLLTNVKSGIDSIRKQDAEHKAARKLEGVKYRIKNNLSLSDEAKEIAIENGLLLK
jgi:polyhydroxyalkanoate synthesis regulator phasin